MCPLTQACPGQGLASASCPAHPVFTQPGASSAALAPACVARSGGQGCLSLHSTSSLCSVGHSYPSKRASVFHLPDKLLFVLQSPAHKARNTHAHPKVSGGQARQRLKQKDHGFGASLGYIARPCLSQAKGGEWVSELHGHPMARRTSCGRRSSSRVCCQGRTSRICSVRHYCVFRVEWRHVRTRASPSP
jgi:hypothetical protein